MRAYFQGKKKRKKNTLRVVEGGESPSVPKSWLPLRPAWFSLNLSALIGIYLTLSRGEIERERKKERERGRGPRGIGAFYCASYANMSNEEGEELATLQQGMDGGPLFRRQTESTAQLFPFRLPYPLPSFLPTSMVPFHIIIRIRELIRRLFPPQSPLFPCSLPESPPTTFSNSWCKVFNNVHITSH